MKNKIYILLIGMIIILLSCQNNNRIEKSEIETKEGVHYLNDEKFTGVVFENYDNDKLKNEWNIKEGLQDGAFLEYYENGQLNEQINWVSGKSFMKSIMKMVRLK
jgi:antitoxin component YwqK of YwqJK toxin-antitoxin module